MKRLMLLTLAGLAALAVSNAASSAPLKVTSTLDGKKVLPHRIHWVAYPGVGAAQVAEVDFMVDGKQLWVEHHTPYYYGDDGNYLVTSFLKPGPHRFTVEVRTTGGTRASDTVLATVLAAPAPPQALDGTWKAFLPQGHPLPSPPAGYWRLVIDSVGWHIYDTAGTGNLIDVAYPSPGLLEIRTGMATGHPRTDLNGWCNDAPGSPARYRWAVQGTDLRFTFAGGNPCPGFTRFLTQLDAQAPGSWTRSG
jgi:hypothetical protein